jgi:hypothetical protein
MEKALRYAFIDESGSVALSRQGISDLPQSYVLIHQEDSMLSRELQAVDFIAWALFQKYERGNTKFYNRIAPRIVVEELVTRQAWQKEKK